MKSPNVAPQGAQAQLLGRMSSIRAIRPASAEFWGNWWRKKPLIIWNAYLPVDSLRIKKKTALVFHVYVSTLVCWRI